MRKSSQQLHPFTALSLHERATLKQVSEKYYRLLSTSSTPSPRLVRVSSSTNSGVPEPALDLHFTIEELSSSIFNVHKRSTPGHDGVSYEYIAHFSRPSQLRLLEF